MKMTKFAAVAAMTLTGVTASGLVQAQACVLVGSKYRGGHEQQQGKG